MRIAIYAQRLTDDKGQDPENQLRQLREWCAGHEIAHEYVDQESGRKGLKTASSSLPCSKTPTSDGLMRVVLVFGPLSREGMMPTIACIYNGCFLRRRIPLVHRGASRDRQRDGAEHPLGLALPHWPSSEAQPYRASEPRRGCCEHGHRASVSAGRLYRARSRT